MNIREDYLFGGFIPLEKKLLVFSYNNFLLDFDLENGIMRFSQSINTEICKMATKVDWFIQAGNYLVATSMWGNYAYIYDERMNKWVELDILCHQKPWGNFLDVFSYNGYAYIIPRYRDFYIKIDLEKRKVVQVVCPVLGQMDKERVVICRRESLIYFFEQYGCSLFIFDLETGNYIKKDLPDTMKDIVSVRVYKDFFFILSGCGCLDTWDEKANVLQRIVEPRGEADSNLFVDLAVTQQNIWLLPQSGDDIYVYDYPDRVLRKYEDYPSDYRYADFENYSKFARGHVFQDKIYFGMHSANYLLRIDENTGKEEWIAPLLPTEQEAYLYRQKQGLSLIENEEIVSLCEYIDEIPSVDNSEIVYTCEERTIGVQIWETLMRARKGTG